MNRAVAVLYDAMSDARFHPGAVDAANDILPTVLDVAAALRAGGWHVETLPLRRPIGCAMDRLRAMSPLFVFNLCEGIDGDATMEGVVAGRLELAGLPFTGNSSAALHLCLRKGRVKDILRSHGISVPPGVTVDSPDEAPADLPEFPLIVKPAREDASILLAPESVVRSRGEALDRVAHVISMGCRPVIVERYIEGREFNAARVGTEMLPISEIDFTRLPQDHPRIVTYDAKWTPGSAADEGTQPVCPARISGAQKREIETVAHRVFSVLELRDYARIDLRLDERGRLFVLEANPNPDLSADAGLARAAAVRGWDYGELVRRIASCALERAGTDASIADDIDPAPGRVSRSRA